MSPAPVCCQSKETVPEKNLSNVCVVFQENKNQYILKFHFQSLTLPINSIPLNSLVLSFLTS